MNNEHFKSNKKYHAIDLHLRVPFSNECGGEILIRKVAETLSTFSIYERVFHKEDDVWNLIEVNFRPGYLKFYLYMNMFFNINIAIDWTHMSNSYF